MPVFISCGIGTSETVGRDESAAVVAVTMTTSGMRFIGGAVSWSCYVLVGLLLREADRSIDDRHNDQHCQ